MALVVILSIVVIVTVLVVALLTLAGGERRSASMALQRTQAELLADAAADLAKATISDATLRGSQPGRTWASEPGRITIFNIASGSGAITRESVDLFSAPATATNQVDLNAPSLAGQFPIAPPAPGNTQATMKVGWQYILRDPSLPASADNPIVGRIAYWVDDESAKVNINTADGSRKGNDGHYGSHPTANPSEGYSFGFGTPSEISLAALPRLNQAKARAIADTAWEEEFNSAEEIVRATDSDGGQVVTRDDFEALRFDITHYNSSPDLNFLGEPRISLMRSLPAAAGVPARRNALLGPTESPERLGGPGTNLSGLPLDHVYPQPGQLPRPPYLAADSEYFLHLFGRRNFGTSRFMDPAGATGSSPTDNDYFVGRIITRYLSNQNQQGQTFTWPRFAGADAGGFASKYTARQLDSITLQLIDTAATSVLVDQVRVYSLPSVLYRGWLSDQPVLGIGRSPRLTEMLFDASATRGDPFGYGPRIGDPGYSYPLLRISFFAEFYFPTGFAGMPNHLPYEGATTQWGLYGGSPRVMNFYDHPRLVAEATQFRPSGNGTLGSSWMDVLLTAVDQNDEFAGINFFGPSSQWDDPDQTKASIYHPYTKRFDPLTGEPVSPERFSGSVYQPSGSPRSHPVLEYQGPFVATGPRQPGVYTSRRNRYPTTDHPARPDATEIKIQGGLHVWIANESGDTGSRFGSLAPFDSTYRALQNLQFDSSAIEEMRQMVIPVDFTVGVPGTERFLTRVADPLVNQLPGDWEGVTDPADSEITMELPSTNHAHYRRPRPNGDDPHFSSAALQPLNTNGDNPGFRPSGGGDPLSVWLPRQDPRIPKQARFPSVGGLFSIRTGLMPDPEVATRSPRHHHGVSFRGLNFSPSTQPSQRTEGGTSYPDWAMLDLFTVPFLPQRPYGPGTPVSEPQRFRRLTDGGATIGRLNINNPPVPYPFAENPGINSQPPRRNALDALFFGLRPSNRYNGSGDPIYAEIDAAAARTLSERVAAYQAANGPFFMAGEIANVPEIADFLYTFSAQTSGPNRAASISRNDVVRDTVGAITTRSNAYSVWIVAETITKAPGNTNYGVFEQGDRITSEVRRRYLVERFIDLGIDGVPGNSDNPSYPNHPNTYTAARVQGDVVSTGDPKFHPPLTYPLPYRWRTLSVENFQN